MTAVSEPRLRAARILVVDDDRAVTRILRAMLQVGGFEVEEAWAVEGLAERIEAAPPDLLLVDRNMPGLGGLDLVADLRARALDLPVLLLTGEDEEGRLAGAARRAGVREVLVKPVALDRLLAAVRGALGAAG